MQMVGLNEADLLARIKNFEDHLVERKVISDQKDWKMLNVRSCRSCDRKGATAIPVKPDR
jgi:hypothetical protein